MVPEAVGAAEVVVDVDVDDTEGPDTQYWNPRSKLEPIEYQ